MEALQKARGRVRREFKKVYDEVKALLDNERLDPDAINVKFKILSDVFENLQQHDSKIIEEQATTLVSEEEEDKEFDEIREYKVKYETLRIRKERKLATETPALVPYSESTAGVMGGVDSRLRNFKLPTIQMKKFSGELIDWLTFWAQFKKIDEHPGIMDSDKLTYLIQLLEPGTDAYEIAMGYFQTNENYPMVVAALKKRYGNEDILLQVYIRQLLNLVITNVNAKDKIPVKNLYMKLDSHLRSLKSLNLEKADPATWLFPLVESSLPEKILDNWQRSALATHDGSTDDPPQTRLDLLMSFVEKEVEIKQRIEITKSFGAEKTSDSRNENRGNKPVATHSKSEKKSIPTLSSFHNAVRKTCAFCGKDNHTSGACYRAKAMTYEQRIDFLKQKNLCFRCCGPHRGNQCTEKLECGVCKRSHYTILCKNSSGKRKRDSDSKDAEPSAKLNRVETNAVKTTTSCAGVECSNEVALQTVMMNIVTEGKVVTVRAFIDGGCQRSYILASTARRLGLEPVGIEKVVHALFGGRMTPSTTHKKYRVKIGSVDGDFDLDVTVRESNQLCGKIPRVTEEYPKLMEELQELGVTLSDRSSRNSEIEVIIGSDIFARLIEGDVRHLRCGASAIRTKLGWTLLGELGATDDETSMASLYLTMCVSDANVTQLWELEAIGIRDTAEEAAIKRKVELAKEAYASSISRDDQGRYVVGLPWKENLPLLPSNRDVAYKRLLSATKKLNDINMFHRYHSIFQDWLREKFIEKVEPNTSELTSFHYLPHRPVVKPESLTTPVRPVFDASCRVGKKPSLNDCLLTGENCIQLIPEILLRFRAKRVGFVADIRKAFQMIGVKPEDRDVLRFLWWEDEKAEKLVEYRHARVVFGATCSPFILAAVLHYHLSNLTEDKQTGLKLLSTLYVDNCAHSEDNIEDYLRFRDKATELMRGAAMDLRLWMSNVEDTDNETTRVISVLGLQWDRKEDELFVNVKNLSEPPKVTKRTILSAVQKIFDPVGFTSPCLLPMKILLQRTWLSKKKSTRKNRQSFVSGFEK